ncbi:hypothetical protein [Bifidobacterium sp. SO1]|uniref:hypothetical protein n=1 Tax=Bifidobacterium sp. SO1 TaxID=2809029 RepID=UPI001BDD32E3|nr:hypothetical protein [Bifidobacterium sp. SO1]MBT1162761.1 hypothetical protein [Bifidobacterium sp. SO1]
MEFNLGEDQKKNPINWDTTATPLLTITGRTAAGKSILLDRILQNAADAGMTITYMGLPRPLPSPTIMTGSYEKVQETIDLLERAVAEQQRRIHGTPSDLRPLLFAFDDFDLIFNGRIEHDEPVGDYQTISRLIEQLIRNASTSNTIIVIVGQCLNNHTIGHGLKTLFRKNGAHAHLSIGPVTSLIDSTGHEYASMLINQEQFDMPHMFGWGVFESASGAISQLRCPIQVRKAA